MITGKQRSYLKGIANSIDPIFQLGKNGLSDNFIQQVNDALKTREIVKVNVLKNCMLDPAAVASELAEVLGAEFVQSIGRKFVLYRQSDENATIVLPK